MRDRCHSLVVTHLRQSCGPILAAGAGGAARVTGGPRADAHPPALHDEALADHPPDLLDELRPLGLLDPLGQLLHVSSSWTGTTHWATIAPVSTPASTTKRVAPATLTPWSSASRGPWIPGKAGRRALCELRNRPPKRARKAGPTSLRKPRGDDEHRPVRRHLRGQRLVPLLARGVVRHALDEGRDARALGPGQALDAVAVPPRRRARARRTPGRGSRRAAPAAATPTRRRGRRCRGVGRASGRSRARPYRAARRVSDGAGGGGPHPRGARRRGAARRGRRARAARRTARPVPAAGRRASRSRAARP